MKFLCDRCKTRYSIADERVRGKVLKIRCKSCSHVITVREGMTDEDPDAVPPSTAKGATRPGLGVSATPAAPGARTSGRTIDAGGSALADAFAQVMQPQGADAEPPPAALEEEWYVSLDGDQQGPFSLPEAQQWVAAKKADDELFCWNEGFDDWLPVDKVSHFRGLRQKAAQTPPPKPPGRGAGKGGAARAEPPKDEPQPLFAATLAALEAEVEAADVKSSKTAPKPKDTTTAKAKETPAPDAAQKKTNGKASAVAGPSSPSAAASAALASLTPTSAGVPSRSGRSTASRFDLGDEGGTRGGESAPDMDAAEDGAVENEDLEIGEVSRVVRLPDLMAAHQKRTAARVATSRTGPAAALRTPAPSIARGTGGVPALAAAAAAPDGAAVPVDGALLGDGGLVDAHPPVPPVVHKHTTLFLVAGVVAALVIGVVVALIVSSRSDDGGPVAFGDTSRYDSLGRRIDDPRRAGGTKGSEPGKTGGRSPGILRRAPFGNTGATSPGVGSTAATGKTETIIGPDGQPLTPLTVDDVLQVSSRMSSGTRRCYERALKEDPFLKVTKITVDLVVENTGVVSSVTLDSFQNGLIGKCLTAAIRRWPFRRSTKRESFRFPLVFEQR